MELIRDNIYLAPEELLPSPQDAAEFAAFFGTYLTASFDVHEEPGTRGAGPANSCFCDICLRIANAPHLQPKKLFAKDKRRANQLMAECLAEFAKRNDIIVDDPFLDQIVLSKRTRRKAALLTYCHWLILRMAGESDGPAILALWRLVSRTSQGGMIKGFKLSTDHFEVAEKEILSVLKEHATLR